MTDPAVWNSFCSIADIQSMVQYYAAQIYIANKDWSEYNNIRLWRTRDNENDAYGDGRWRWIVYDTDYSANLFENTLTAPNHNSYADTLQQCPLFASAMQNEEFRSMFLQQIQYLADTWTAEYVSSKVDAYMAEWSDAMYVTERVFHFGADMDHEKQLLIDFFTERGDYITGFVSGE